MARSVSDIQADLDAFYAARRALATGAQSYSINTGQTTQSVTRADLGKINETIRQIEHELEMADFESTGSDSVTLHRGTG